MEKTDLNNWEKEFDENKAKLFPEDKVIMIKTYPKTEYLHKIPDYIEWDLFTGTVRYVPEEFYTNIVEEGSIDQREVTVVEKKYTQSEVVKSLIKELLTHQRSEVLETVKKIIESKKIEIYKHGYGVISKDITCYLDHRAGVETSHRAILDDIIQSINSLSNNKS